jgi:hypothetical protein
MGNKRKADIDIEDTRNNNKNAVELKENKR